MIIMDATINLIIFYALSGVILLMSVLAVTTKKILRAASYLLFILIGTAGLYLMLNYHFLAAVQITVYAGGVLVLFIFAIFLVNSKGDEIEPDEEGLVFYDRVLDDLLSNGIEPVITISHDEMPLQLVKEYSGWSCQKLIYFFVRYLRVLFERFCSKVKYWMTFPGISKQLAEKTCREVLPEAEIDCRDIAELEHACPYNSESILLVLA